MSARNALSWWLMLAAGCWAAAASAQGAPFDRGADDVTPPGWVDGGYWSEGEPRLFVSTRSELGLPYAKPYVSFGYGQPHWVWAGIDVNAIATLEVIQGYAGVRAALPVLDLAFGLRNTKSFGKPFLPPAESYDAAAVLDAPGEGARYWAWEAEAVATVPLPHAALVADFIAVRTLDVPENHLVYDESYRGVVRSPLFFVLRMGAVVRFMNEDALKVGAILEHLFGTGRAQPVWRVGPAFALQLTHHLEAMAALTLAAESPDALGLALGAYGVAGVRYRWASGERRPELPWTGEIIP